MKQQVRKKKGKDVSLCSRCVFVGTEQRIQNGKVIVLFQSVSREDMEVWECVEIGFKVERSEIHAHTLSV